MEQVVGLACQFEIVFHSTLRSIDGYELVETRCLLAWPVFLLHTSVPFFGDGAT